MTPTDTIISLEKALEAGPTPGAWTQAHRMANDGCYYTRVRDAAVGHEIATLHWVPRPTVDGVTGTYREANAAFIAAANPLAIRTLLDAHASALRDAEKLRKALTTLCRHFPTDDDMLEAGWGTTTIERACDAYDAAIAAALDDNTKGAASALGPLDQLP